MSQNNEFIETSHVFTFLHDTYLSEKAKIIFALEGSSGAAKTWGAIDFIIEYCRINAFEDKRITIGRETYRDCIDTVAHDFFKRLKQIGAYSNKNHYQSHPQTYILLGNEIDFTGWSNNGQPSKRQDVLWFNEILESEEEVFKQYNQRTNDLVICDWNPKVTQHWVYDKILNRKDCRYKHCLMLDNPFLPDGQKNEILAYEPTPENVEAGTADDFMWKVYGLGQRAANKDQIFKNVRYIDTFPDIAHHYGMDFGFTSDPTAIVQYAETETDIYLQLECYEPIETPEEINDYAIGRGIDINLPTTADSSDKHVSEKNGTVEMVKGLKKLGWRISKVSKTQSVMFWLLKMKKKRINIVKNDMYLQAKREAENYKMKSINGIAINQPIDKFNHFWDAARYAHMAANKPTRNIPGFYQ